METFYELEKVRFYRYKATKYTVIAESQNLKMLTVMANEIKIRNGKTFGEKVTIAERTLVDSEDYEKGDVLDYPYIRYVGDEI